MTKWKKVAKIETYITEAVSETLGKTEDKYEQTKKQQALVSPGNQRFNKRKKEAYRKYIDRKRDKMKSIETRKDCSNEMVAVKDIRQNSGKWSR